MDSSAFEGVFAKIDPPLWLVTCRHEGRRSGLIATFVNQASITPRYPRVAVGLAPSHFTTELIQKKGAFVLHLLAPRHVQLVWRFGLETGRQGDKFGGLATTDSSTGNPRLIDIDSWLDCLVEATLDVGGRVLYVARVVEAAANADAVLTASQMLQLASDEQKERLQALLERDAAIEDQAIERWLKEQGKPTGNSDAK